MSRNPNSVGHWCHYKMYPQQCRDLRVSVLNTHSTTGRTGPGLRECLTSCWISTTVPEWPLNQRSVYTDTGFLCGPARVNEHMWQYSSPICMLTLGQCHKKEIKMLDLLIVLQDESPDSLINMYINPNLTVMSKTPHIWGKRQRRKKWSNLNEQLEQIPAEALRDLPNVALLSRPDSCVTLVDTI